MFTTGILGVTFYYFILEKPPAPFSFTNEIREVSGNQGAARSSRWTEEQTCTFFARKRDTADLVLAHTSFLVFLLQLSPQGERS